MSLITAIKKLFSKPFLTPPETHKDKYIGERIGNSVYYISVSGYNLIHPENKYKYILKLNLTVNMKMDNDLSCVPLYSYELEKNVFIKTYERCPDEAYNNLLSKAITQTQKHFKKHLENIAMVELLETYDLYIQDNVLMIEKR